MPHVMQILNISLNGIPWVPDSPKKEIEKFSFLGESGTQGINGIDSLTFGRVKSLKDSLDLWKTADKNRLNTRPVLGRSTPNSLGYSKIAISAFT